GTMARFNGGSATATDSLATVLAYDDTGGTPPRSTPHSGYVRMQRGRTLIVARLPPPPAAALSTQSPAGCLALPVRSRAHAIIVNCGAPSPDHDEWRMFARSTPAHSTLAFEEISSATFAGGGNGAKPDPDAELSGPPNVQVSLSEEDGGLVLSGSHEGYVT